MKEVAEEQMKDEVVEEQMKEVEEGTVWEQQHPLKHSLF